MTPSKTKSNNTIKVVNNICAGIDIHRDTANVTLLIGASDGKMSEEYREYSTSKEQLLSMKKWLLDNNCRVVGIESTGKYWQPVHNALEDAIKVNLYNARSIKNIPGKKTDKSDSKWIANITRHDMIKPSFIPSKQIRDARLLARTRLSIVQSRSSFRQSIHGVLQAASIKLSSNMSDIFGSSGLNLLALIATDRSFDQSVIKSLVYNKLKDKADLLMNSMDGYIRETHRRTLSKLLEIIQQLTEYKDIFENELAELLLDTQEHKDTYSRLQDVPGISSLSGLLLLAEIGYNLESFPNENAFCSWVGLCPGNKESAGKKISGRIYVKKHYVKTLLIELAWVAVKTKDTYYSAKFKQLRYRKGPQKAIVAIAHKMGKAVFNIIRYGNKYIELSPEHLQDNEGKKNRNYAKKLISKIGIETMMELMDEVELNNNI